MRHRKKIKMSEAKSEPWEDNFRLPLSVHPDHYDLYLYPNLNTKTFSGNVAIEVTSSESRDYFLVHTKWLNISSTSIVSVAEDGGERNIELVKTFEYEPNEFWVMKTKGLVGPGLYKIKLNFSGSLTKGIVGFYYSEYLNESGVSRGLATTKFEPTYCRQAFPSFDEPTFKSTYSVTIVKPSRDYIALSNMPVESEAEEKPEAGLTEVTFEKSVPMVTYLVCFIVCDFTYKEEVLPSKMPFRVYGPKERIDNTQYSLEIGQKILQYYEKVFKIPFPLPKSDMAAIPDYSSGATEHWGIITFRESNLFYNENASSATNHQRVSSVVAHELAHQWFGNLVTLNWWNDLWLNEGFASYIEGKGVAEVHPDWDMEVQFIIGNLQRVFVLDSKLSSHPIVQVVTTPDEITAMFDLISYEKGASVLRMLEGFLSEEVFQNGVNSFLNRFAYDNAVTQDLWDELTAAWEGHVPEGQKNDVGAIMDSWTKQMGYPVVSVEETSDGALKLTQKRFLQDPTASYDPNESEFKYTWDIPVRYITSASPSKPLSTWFYRDQSGGQVDIGDATWYKINADQIGYYRVNYEPKMWQKFEDLCDKQILGPADRSSLYDDAFALADASLLDYNVALNFSRSLAKEDHYVPWLSAKLHFGAMIDLLLETNVGQSFKKYVEQTVDPIYTKLGWNNDGTHLDKLLRNQIVSLACVSSHETCLLAAGDLLQSWISDAAYKLPLGTKRQVYRNGLVKAGSEENWDVMWERCLAEQSATERDNLYYGLANSKDENILTKYIKLAQDEKNVRTQDFLKLLQYIASNPAGSNLVWKWVRENWDWLVSRYTLNDRYLGQLVPSISEYFATEQKLKEMQDFFAKYPDAGAGALYREQALETVKFNIRWVSNNSQIISQWLDKQ